MSTHAEELTVFRSSSGLRRYGITLDSQAEGSPSENHVFVGSQKPENSSASKLPDQLRDGTACFSGTSIVARDLEVLRSLSFRAICEFTRRLYVPSGGRPYLGFSDRFCPRAPLGVSWDYLRKSMFVRVRRPLAFESRCLNLIGRHLEFDSEPRYLLQPGRRPRCASRFAPRRTARIL